MHAVLLLLTPLARHASLLSLSIFLDIMSACMFDTHVHTWYHPPTLLAVSHPTGSAPPYWQCPTLLAVPCPPS